MKKFSVILVLLSVSTGCFCQQNNPSSTLTKQDYLQKSKHQKTAAWILLGGGAAMGLISAIANPGNDIVTTAITGDDGRTGLAKAAGITGFVCMASSIPFFIAASRNKKLGMSLSFKNEKVPQVLKNNWVYRPVPSVSFKMNL